MGKPMEETYQCYQLLKCLPSKFDSIVQNILRWTDETFKYKDVLLELIAGRNQNRFPRRRECRNGTAASSGTSNRRSRTYEKVQNCVNIQVSNPSIRHLRPFGSTLYVGTPRPLRGKLDPKAKKGILVGFALGTRGYRVWIPEDSKVIETSNVHFQKPQQSNGGAVLASPNLKFSDYEVFENGDDDTDEDERVHNIPISLPQDSDSKTEGENLSRTENSTVPVKTTWKRVVIP
ncbi:retrovirus-related Pol polyprotein from transposon TNT 1-94 [Trichonephila clavipes]|nr:retrovirus-related Pol polyprotein from transposon TNT 1-94 [Trichonephila clavipes]